MGFGLAARGPTAARLARLVLALGLVAMALVGGGAQARAAAAAAHRPSGLLVSSEVASSSLGTSVPVVVYLPPGYPESRLAYPVLYLLHGLPGSGPLMTRKLNLEAQLNRLIDSGAIQPMVIVLPSDGPTADTDTEWMNSRFDPSAQWGTFVSDDLVQWVDENYSVCTARTATSIGGVSMGAFGALNAALADPGEFGAVLSWSGYYIANTPSVNGENGSAGWRADSPLYEVPNDLAELSADPLRISIYTEPSDEFYEESLTFAHLLRRERLPFRFAVYSGGHNYEVWSAHLASQLIWLSAGERC